jgi:hypothetical protein
MGRITLAGTGLNLEVSDGTIKRSTPFYIDSDYTIPTT